MTPPLIASCVVVAGRRTKVMPMPDEDQSKSAPHLRPFQRKPLPPPEPGTLASEAHRAELAAYDGRVPQPSMRELMDEANAEALQQQQDAEAKHTDDVARLVADEYETDDDEPPTPTALAWSLVSDHSMTEVDWLWFPWLAYGKLAVLDGDPSLGKSTMALSFAACVTTGHRFPMENAPIEAREPATVVVLSAEDSAGDTIAPRLYEAGARPERVVLAHNVNGRFIHLPEDINALRRLIVLHHARFVVIDVLAAYIGGHGMNSHADADVRTVLAQLSSMAEDTNAAILALRHLNKTSSEHNAMYRGGGSIAIIGAARTAFVVAKHPREDTRRVLACVKNNLAPMPEPIMYSVVRGDKWNTARVQWHQEPCNVTLVELMRGPTKDTPGPEPMARDVAADLIVSFLEDGPKLVVDIVALAELGDISQATLYRAKKDLGIRSRIENTDDGKRTWWSLPDHGA